jgi:thiamine pyrophosphate-dependent acetolactate synthase large subunit-like protein
MLHEVTDQRATTAPLTAFSRTARSAEEVGDSLVEAFAVFASERPRPVHIEIPIDVLARSCNLTPVAKVSPAPPTPDESGIAAAAGMLSAARSPAIVVGGGARAAGSAIAEIAEALGAPIATTLAGKGCVPDDHPLHLGAMLHREEVRELLRAADVVLALGTELAETDTWSGSGHRTIGRKILIFPNGPMTAACPISKQPKPVNGAPTIGVVVKDRYGSPGAKQRTLCTMPFSKPAFRPVKGHRTT